MRAAPKPGQARTSQCSAPARGSIIDVHPPTMPAFPIGKAMNKNLTLRMGNCNHRRYIPMLIDLVQNGTLDPSKILTQQDPLTVVLDAYKAFGTRQTEWLNVDLKLGDGTSASGEKQGAPTNEAASAQRYV